MFKFGTSPSALRMDRSVRFGGMVCAAALIAVLAGPGATAQQAEAVADAPATSIEFNVAEQSLATALVQYQRQAGVQLAYRSADIPDVQAPALKGSMSASDALETLLQGTGLNYQPTGADTYALFAPAGAAAGNSRGAKSGQVGTGNSDIPLEDAETVGTVVVSATGFEQQIEDAPATISVITAEEIQRGSYSNITQVLDDIPGISIETSGGGRSKSSGTTSINMRGFSDTYILFLVDGKPVGSPEEAYYNGWGGGQKIQLLPPPGLIERIEVIRGPMSSLYGSGALGGTINIITKKTTDVWTGSLSVGQVRQTMEEASDTLETSYYLTGPVIAGRVNLTVFGATYDRDPDNYSGGSIGSNRRSNGVRLNGVISTTQDIALEYSNTEQKTFNGDLSSGRNQNAGVRSTRDNLSLTHNIEWANGFKTTSFIVNDDISVENGSNFSGYDKLNFNTKTLMGFGNHMLTVGGDYRDETTTHAPGRIPAGVDPEMNRWHAALFAEDEWGITSDFILTTGLRYDENERFGDHFTPRLYGVYRMDKSLTFKGGVSGGYKLPDLKESDSGILEPSGGDGNSRDQGNTDLTPEESVNYEIGMIYTSQKNWQAGVTLYHTNFTDKIQKETLCGPGNATKGDVATFECTDPVSGADIYQLSQYINVDEAEIRGVEATFDIKIRNVDLSANYTYSDSEVTKGANIGERLNSLPEHMINLGADWAVTSKFKLWADAKYKSKTNDAEPSARTPAYTIVDVGATYNFNKNLQGVFTAYNALNKEIPMDEYGSVIDELKFYFGLNATF